MSFSTTTRLRDKLLCVLKLDIARINWVVYKDRFLWSINARGLIDHLEGTEVEPTDPIDAAIRATIAMMLLDIAQVLVNIE